MSDKHAVPALGTAIAATLLSGALVVARHEPGAPSSRAALAAAAAGVDLAALAVAPRGEYRELHSGRGDASAIAEMSGRAEVRGTLRSLGLRDGHIRVWRTVDRRSTVTAFVLEFADEAGAREYADDLAGTDALRRGGRSFAVAGVPAAAGLAAAADAGGRFDQVVVLRHGRLACVLVYAGSGVAPAPALVDLARRQYDALAVAAAA